MVLLSRLVEIIFDAHRGVGKGVRKSALAYNLILSVFNKHTIKIGVQLFLTVLLDLCMPELHS